ncbi:hypothetical protein IYX23_05360 [Methylocystis sp. L43]|uniref:hypothetical protein n=1 Tax=unclassified Methylocystis TaxID=2625913 RepID=UPI0018C290D3|nr:MULTISPECIES: hypothetical protein [unclassified Methylocystis]MBG0797114.1 hypothetical protein [Methylocystis sp. L43]MBG0805015.1 hypothetical protein [Methylocystis sp. H15]
MTDFINLVSEHGDARMFPRASIKNVATEREAQGHLIYFREPTRDAWFLGDLADLDSPPAEAIVGAAPGWAVVEIKPEGGLLAPTYHPVLAWRIRLGEAPEPIHVGPPVQADIVIDAEGFAQNWRRNSAFKFDEWLAKRQRSEFRKAGWPTLTPDADGVLRLDFAPPGSESRELAFAEEIVTSDDPNFADIARSEIEAMHARFREAEAAAAE